MVDRPTLKVEVGFAATALGSVTTWTDISSFVRSGSTNVGRSSEVDDYAAGSLSLTLDNRARTFDPFYSAGPFLGTSTPENKSEFPPPMRPSVTIYFMGT